MRCKAFKNCVSFVKQRGRELHWLGVRTTFILAPESTMARLSAIGLLAVLLSVRSASGDDSPETFFELNVRPLLATNCLPCHGGKKTSSGLIVSSRELLVRGGDRGAAIIPGNPDK